MLIEVRKVPFIRQKACLQVVRVPAAFLAVLDTHVIACIPHMHAEGVVEVSHNWPVSTSPGTGHISWTPRRMDLMHVAVKRCIELLPALEPFVALQLVQSVSRIARHAAVDLGPRRYRSLRSSGRLGDLTLVGKGIVADAVEKYVDERLPEAKRREERYLRLMVSAAGISKSSPEDMRGARGFRDRDFR